MSVYNNAIYSKNGAIFANGAEAYAEKNSLYSPELQTSVDNCYAQMLADGILLEPVNPTWDQATFTLTNVKLVSSTSAYTNAITFNPFETVAKAEAAGWTLESPPPPG